MLKKSIIIILFVMLFCSFAFAVNAEELKPITLTWTAGGVGGGWYVQAGGIASLVNEKEPKITIKVVPGGGVVNPMKINKGEDDLGWGITCVDKMAFDGTAPIYKEACPNIRALGGIFGTYLLHICAAEDTGITTIAEMAERVKEGKAIKVAAPMKGTSEYPLINAILGFYGISYEDIEAAGGKVFYAAYADMVTLYKDRHVDFVFTHLSIPAAAITEMAVSRKMTVLVYSDECIDFMHEKWGTLSKESEKCVIPAGTYKGQEKDVQTAATAGELLINKDVPVEVAYTIIKILCENSEELYTIDRANKTFIPEKGWKDVVVPLHSGAEMYYKEAGYMK